MNLWEAARPRAAAAPALSGETMPAIFWQAAAARAGRVLMRHKQLGLWREWTWAQAADAVREIGHGLLALGLRRGDCVAILANTRVEWLLADLAVLGCGGVSAGVYPTDSPQQLHYLCADSRSVLLFVEDEEQLDKALSVRAQLPDLARIVVFDAKGLRDFRDDGVLTLAALRALGREHLAQHPGALEAATQACRPADVAMLVYTSGTTGKPKGAIHTHGGIVQTVRGYAGILAQDERDERICFLPLCHIAERIGGEYFGLYSGAVLNFVERPETVPENLREIAPTTITAVPRVWEKLYSAVTLAVGEAGAVQQAAYRWALRVGRRVAERVLAQQPVPLALKLQFRLARAVVLDNVCTSIGLQRARVCISGAAPISPELIRWYLSLGVPMLEGWGMTETCGAAAVTPLARIKPGSVGPAAPYNRIRIDARTGEIQVKGPNVFEGYLNLPEQTAETFTPDGWLRTGDVGTLDDDGYLRITDRMKDVIVTAGGKNVTPSEIENELKFSPYVTDAVVLGDRRPYLVAIVMIDQDNVEKFAQDHDVPFSNYTSLTRAPAVQRLIGDEIARVNARYARAEQVKRFHLLETLLGAEDEELTPTMKLKRRLIEQKYAERIEAMYR